LLRSSKRLLLQASPLDVKWCDISPASLNFFTRTGNNGKQGLHAMAIFIAVFDTDRKPTFIISDTWLNTTNATQMENKEPTLVIPMIVNNSILSFLFIVKSLP
jgi:hypothetical protein